MVIKTVCIIKKNFFCGIGTFPFSQTQIDIIRTTLVSGTLASCPGTHQDSFLIDKQN